jgi:hypothetical protein
VIVDEGQGQGQGQGGKLHAIYRERGECSRMRPVPRKICRVSVRFLASKDVNAARKTSKLITLNLTLLAKNILGMFQLEISWSCGILEQGSWLRIVNAFKNIVDLFTGIPSK